MAWIRTADEGSGKMTSAIHPTCSSYEHIDEQFGPIHEEYYNLFDE